MLTQATTIIMRGGPMDGLDYNEPVELLSIALTSRKSGLRHIYELTCVEDGVAVYDHAGVNQGM